MVLQLEASEKRPITEVCQLCGTTLVMGHVELRKQRGRFGKFGDMEWVVVDHKKDLKGPCPKSADGRHHVLDGMY